MQPPKRAYEEATLVTKLFIELKLLDIVIESWHKFSETLKEQAQRASESERIHHQKHEEEEGAYREHIWLCPYINRQVRVFESLSGADPLHCHCRVHLPV